MLTGRSVNLVNYQNAIGFLKFHAAPMREAAIPALPLDSVALGVGLPRKNCNLRMIGPTKRAGCRRLITAVYAYCVVRLGGAKPIAPLLLAHVGACAGIDQDFFVARAHHNAQRVRVAVAGAPRPEAAGVEDHLIDA